MALRDVIKIGSRVVGGAAGFAIGGPVGAFAGYQAGSLLGDAVGGEAPVANTKAASITEADPLAGFATKAQVNRESRYVSQLSQPGISDKITGVADPIVAASSTLYSLGTSDTMKKKPWKTQASKDMGTYKAKTILDDVDETIDNSGIDVSTLGPVGYPSIRNTEQSLLTPLNPDNPWNKLNLK
jgi:hypothetical protein